MHGSRHASTRALTSIELRKEDQTNEAPRTARGASIDLRVARMRYFSVRKYATTSRISPSVSTPCIEGIALAPAFA